MNGFDILAPIYDKSVQLIFGENIKKSSVEYFHYIKPNDNVLILGGGTGQILDYLKLEEINVHYVEISMKMVQKAKKHDPNNHINFIHGSYSAIPDIKFDVVILPFILDLFTTKTAQEIVNRIKVNKQAHLLFADFKKPEKSRQKFLLKAMYFFFRFICKIEGLSLPDYSRVFKNYKLLEGKTFFHGMIVAQAFSKTP